MSLFLPNVNVQELGHFIIDITGLMQVLQKKKVWSLPSPLAETSNFKKNKKIKNWMKRVIFDLDWAFPLLPSDEEEDVEASWVQSEV